jgi:mRNA-degrading endonuclease RelE of RelBE toxin-antitoxin system
LRPCASMPPRVPANIKKLQGQRDEWRLRVGDWRVIFSLRSGEIIVLDILNRRDAYR